MRCSPSPGTTGTRGSRPPAIPARPALRAPSTPRRCSGCRGTGSCEGLRCRPATRATRGRASPACHGSRPRPVRCGGGRRSGPLRAPYSSLWVLPMSRWDLRFRTDYHSLNVKAKGRNATGLCKELRLAGRGITRPPSLRRPDAGRQGSPIRAGVAEDSCATEPVTSGPRVTDRVNDAVTIRQAICEAGD
jgi:hypothetical protein